jgi:AAA+ superfamily predicted ATPase
MDKAEHFKVLQAELDWMQEIMEQVIRSYLKHEGHEKSYLNIEPPNLKSSETLYAQLVREHQLSFLQRLALALCLTPLLRPQALDLFFGKNKLIDRPFTEFGGLTSDRHSGFLPTLQTFYFLSAGTAPEKMVEAMEVVQPSGCLVKEGIVVLGKLEDSLPEQARPLQLGRGWLDYFLTGRRPDVSQRAEFPAQRITTNMEWEDVVLSEAVRRSLNEMANWLLHGDDLLNNWGLKKMIKPGYRALFYGPPGTGKTLTAALLGKSTGKDVYKIDLSMLVSKYIGETEKNLEKVFRVAEEKNWILFFDEADALFGKRTNANSSNDRFANQQTSYLLQRVESYPGVVVLASNLKGNIDTAFSRRFQSMIHFPMPDVEERLKLWQNAFSLGCRLEEGVDLPAIAETYEISGGAIINVLRSCALEAIKNDKKTVGYQALLHGIRKEFKKENKTVAV